MNRYVSVVTTFILMAWIGSANAQERPPEPLQVVASLLQLSEEQIAAWLPILEERHEALLPLQQQLQANQEAIAQELQSPAPDAQAIGELFIARRALEMNVAGISSEFASRFEELLTVAQRERLHQIRAAAQACRIVPAFAAAGLL